MSTRTFEVENIGPVPRAAITIPEDGGVVIWLGVNGSGKTHILDAAQALTSGKKVPLDLRDGAIAGEVSGFGATIHVARRTSYSGELEVNSLEGRFSIADIVEPGIKEPEAADAKRIKALVALSTGDADAQPSLFYELLGGKEEFEAEVSLRTLAAPDITTMAAQAKRDLEAGSRHYGELSIKAKARYEADRQSVAGVDLNLPDDEKALADGHEIAVRALARLESDHEHALAVKKTADEASAAWRKHPPAADYTETAEWACKEADGDVMDALEAEAKAIRELEAARAELRVASENASARRRELVLAQLNQRVISEWHAQIEAAANVEPVPAEVMESARLDVTMSRDALTAGAEVRRAKAKLSQSLYDRDTMRETEEKSIQLRDAAQATDNVLSKIVARLDCPLRVSRGRLVTTTDRGEELFADLSPGEKWTLVLQIAIRAVGPKGLIVLPQHAWEGLDPLNQKLIDDTVRGTGVVVLTAQASDDPEVRAVIFDPNAPRPTMNVRIVGPAPEKMIIDPDAELPALEL
jgi:hypothetical protein